MKTVFAYIILALFVAATPPGTARAQMQPAHTGHDVLLFLSVFRGLALPLRYVYLDQAITDYGPGAFSPAVSEQSIRFVTVMEGQLKFTVGRKTDSYGPGKSFSVPPEILLRGSNESRTVKARLFISAVVPPIGADAVTAPGTRNASPAPVSVCTSRFPVGPLPSIIDVYQVGHVYEPGFVTPPHIMNEVHDILQLEGVNTYEYLDGTVEHYGPCQASPMYVGRPGTMGNTGAAPSVFVLTYLATPGKPLFSPVH